MAQQFPLPKGTALPQGEVVGLTDTAYKVVTPEGGTVFVPFYGPRGVHPTSPASPLVVLS